MQRYVLKLAYEGGAFWGWQRQAALPSVAQTVEAALSRICQQPIQLTGAGRTDRGVHATAQYAHWDGPASLPPRFLSRLQALLPEAIQPLALYRVEAAFHVRHDALWREYRYFLASQSPLFWRRYVWEVRELPPIERLQAAAALWRGVHDFRAFCKEAAKYPHTQCEVSSCNWSTWSSPEDAPVLAFRIRANRFLHGMVRFLVGASVAYAMGRLSLERLQWALERGDPSWGMRSAPPQGLYLWEVGYAPEALYLLERYGPPSARPLPATGFTADPKPTPDSNSPLAGAASAGDRPAD